MTLSPQVQLETSDQVRDRLRHFAVEYAAHLGYQFAPVAKDRIRELIRPAGVAIQGEVGGAERRELFVRQAEAALTFLIEKAIFHQLTNANQQNAPGIIDETALAFSINILCPCWPFCGARPHVQ